MNSWSYEPAMNRISSQKVNPDFFFLWYEQEGDELEERRGGQSDLSRGC